MLTAIATSVILGGIIFLATRRPSGSAIAAPSQTTLDDRGPEIVVAVSGPKMDEYRATARGIRNNNPGNLNYSGTPWHGLANPPSDGRFCIFADTDGQPAPIWGIRATMRNLKGYNAKGWNNIYDIVRHWAGETAAMVENPRPELGWYMDLLSRRCAIGDTVRFNLQDKIIVLAQSICVAENGENPYPSHFYTTAQVLAQTDL